MTVWPPYLLVRFGLEILMRIQAVHSPLEVGWSICNSLCSSSDSCLSHTDWFWLFLYPLSLHLAPEQIAPYSLFCSLHTEFQTLQSSFCNRQQVHFFSTAPPASNSPWCPTIIFRLNRPNWKKEKLPVRRGNWNFSVYIFHKHFSFNSRRSCQCKGH